MSGLIKRRGLVSAADVNLEQLYEILRRDFRSFVQKSFNTLTPNTTFVRGWHIDALAHHLELVRLGKIRRLIINLPPRSLKSITASVALPAFALGHNPAERIVSVTYGGDLAVKNANDFRAIVGSPWYKAMFPEMRISNVKNTEFEVLTTRNGYRLATSTGGTLTGRGGDLIIIDDPLKASDVWSDSTRERANQWFINTLLSRLDDKRHARIVITMQRLHQDDLTGFVLRSSDDWTVLKLPAIAQEDERVLIGPDRYHERRVGEVLDSKREPLFLLEEQRRLIGSDLFQAQYLQEPVPPGGLMIRREWLQYYDVAPERKYPCRIIQSWDTASKDGGENDWSVCTTWLVLNGTYYLLDVLRRRMNYPALKAAAIERARYYNPTKILIEDTGVGIGLVAELKQMGLRVFPIRPEGNKLARMSIQSAKFEAGHVQFPRRAPWLATLEAELLSFPGGRHDDQIDSISQALAHGTGGYDTTLSWVG